MPLAPALDFSTLGGAHYLSTPPDSPSTAGTTPSSSLQPTSNDTEASKAAALDILQSSSPAQTGHNNLSPHPPQAEATVLEDSPAPAQAHPALESHAAAHPTSHTHHADDSIAFDTAKATGSLLPNDAAPLPAVDQAPPAVEFIPSGDKAPLPAAEAAPAQQPEQVVAREQVEVGNQVDAVNAAHQTGATIVDPLTVARAPTAQTSPLGNTVEQHDAALGQVNTAAPSTSKPVVPSAESHLAEHPATSTDTDHVLPLGHDVHPVHQAAALQDAPDHLINAQIEKQKADKRALLGEEPQGTIVPGLEDDRLWAMIRRFDDQITHTLTPPTKLPRGQPDLRPTSLPAVPFDSDILKSNLERVYSTIGVYGIYSAREAMRLMSWDDSEKRRTLVWCICYFIAATFGLVGTAVVGILIALMAYPRSRKILFPPVAPPPGVPHSATDPLNRKGDESLIAGVDNPVEHRSRIEQIEEQAWEFTNLVQRFGARVVVGGKAGGRQGNGEVGAKQHVSSDEDENDSDPDDEEMELAQMAEEQGLGIAANKEKNEKTLSDKKRLKRKTKEAKIKRDAIVGKVAKQVQDGLGGAADFFEVFGNAMSPVKPYPIYHAREEIAYYVLAPLALVFAVTPAVVFARLFAFVFGLVFFGQPLLIRGFNLLQEKVPDWQEKLDLRNSLLSGVPTNAQIVLHIVRVAERHYTPFPLPPGAPTAKHMKEAVQSGGFDEDDMGADGYNASSTDKHSVEAGALANKSVNDSDDEDDTPSTKDRIIGKTKGKFVGAFKKVAKKAATFRGDVHIEGDTVQQKVGNLIDRTVYHSRAKDDETPFSFPAKFEGTSGHIIVKHSPSSRVSYVGFVPLKVSKSHPSWEKPIEDIVEMKKNGVAIARTALSWVASISLQGMGLEIRFKPLEQRYAEKAHGGLGEGDKPHEEVVEGETYAFSHVGRRDELFRRLIGISNARWEVL